jgi:hypothetical protein
MGRRRRHDQGKRGDDRRRRMCKCSAKTRLVEERFEDIRQEDRSGSGQYC